MLRLEAAPQGATCNGMNTESQRVRRRRDKLRDTGQGRAEEAAWAASRTLPARRREARAHRHHRYSGRPGQATAGGGVQSDLFADLPA